MNDDLIQDQSALIQPNSTLNNLDSVEILFKVPQESIENITLRVPLSMTIDQVKKEIELLHPLKPLALKQKLFYAGKLLSNPDKVSEVIGSVKEMISRINSNLKEDQLLKKKLQKVYVACYIIQYLSDKYIKYEKELVSEYAKTVRDLNRRRLLNTDRDSFGHYQEQGIDTNMSAKTNLLMTTMPLMERSFQERMGFYSAANNISANIEEFNENIAVRFLGYDSILQFTFIAKLFIFMLIFGINARGIYRWAVIVLLIGYYFHYVRTLYIEHYDRQRRMLNLDQQPPNADQDQQNNNDIRVLNTFFGGLLNFNRDQHQEQQQDSLFVKAKNWVRLVFILVIHLFMSIHHDWIDRRIRVYDRMNIIQQQEQQAQQEQQQNDNNVIVNNDIQNQQQQRDDDPLIQYQQDARPQQQQQVQQKEDEDDVLFRIEDDFGGKVKAE